MTKANTKSLPDSSASPNAMLRLSLVGGGSLRFGWSLGRDLFTFPRVLSWRLLRRW